MSKTEKNSNLKENRVLFDGLDHYSNSSTHRKLSYATINCLNQNNLNDFAVSQRKRDFIENEVNDFYSIHKLCSEIDNRLLKKINLITEYVDQVIAEELSSSIAKEAVNLNADFLNSKTYNSENSSSYIFSYPLKKQANLAGLNTAYFLNELAKLLNNSKEGFYSQLLSLSSIGNKMFMSVVSGLVNQHICLNKESLNPKQNMQELAKYMCILNSKKSTIAEVTGLSRRSVDIIFHENNISVDDVNGKRPRTGSLDIERRCNKNKSYHSSIMLLIAIYNIGVSLLKGKVLKQDFYEFTENKSEVFYTIAVGVYQSTKLFFNFSNALLTSQSEVISSDLRCTQNTSPFPSFTEFLKALQFLQAGELEILSCLKCHQPFLARPISLTDSRLTLPACPSCHRDECYTVFSNHNYDSQDNCCI